MSAPIPALEPVAIIAGDTIPWTKSLSNYSAADGWALSYAFRLQNGSGKVDLTASASGSDFAATLTATVTAQMTPGVWIWAAYVTKAAERYQVGNGIVTVTPNLAKIDYSIDFRSDAKKAYDNAQAAWITFGKAKQVTINGRTYMDRDAGDLIKYVDRCRTDYQSELDALKVAATGVNPRHIGVRFGRP